MPSPCNSLTAVPVKVSSLSFYDNIDSDDLFLTIENNGGTYYSRKSRFSDLATYFSSITNSYTGSLLGTSSWADNSIYAIYTSASYEIFSNTKTAVIWDTYNPYPSKQAQGGQIIVSSGDILTSTPMVTGSNHLWISPYLDSDNESSFFPVPRTGVPGTMNNYVGKQEYGRVICNVPLQHFRPGNQIIFYSGSVHLNNYNPYGPPFTSHVPSSSFCVYAMGMQFATPKPGISTEKSLQTGSLNLFVRTGGTFCLYWSGSYTGSRNVPGSPRDLYWEPHTSQNSSGHGAVVFGTRQRLFAVGNFYDTSTVDAQLHVHLTGSGVKNGVPWPTGYNPNQNVFLVTSGSSYTKLLRVSGSGQLDVAGDLIAFSTFSTSDKNLKNNIVPIENGLDKLSLINPVEFNWIKTGNKDYGIIAQELEEHFPELVSENMDGYKVVKYNSLVAFLIQSIHELKKEIELLKSK